MSEFRRGRHVLKEQEKQINNSVSRFAVCILGDDIIELAESISNDQEFGTKARLLVKKYKNKRQQG